MRGIVGIFTLAIFGIIIADVAAHPAALAAGGKALNALIVPTYQGLLGVAPGYAK